MKTLLTYLLLALIGATFGALYLIAISNPPHP